MSDVMQHTDACAHLVRMANRIGDFFAAYPERAEALDGVATHIRKFWEPRMRRQLYAHLDGPQGGAGLSALVHEAVSVRRDDLLPRA
jgi:formate dehydrogenase subunit delta